ncbi:Trafficking protein particle complex subunit 4 [Porphyridium purpureum]|uniref:Trafficking protein particle complex subunit n=1 Tax=Porphyridium purpureum TaxID=35688 RepID=A0A5J4Z0Q0_PORPP|nr:Trafficking protein particle complex subunit 4 [Porphyridium purpureum]|eukprot:POR0610..scf208_2
MGVQSFFVLNKAGGLIMQRSYSDRAPRLTQNDYIHLASTFHSMQLLVRELSPVSNARECGGIARMEATTFRLYAMIAATGVEMFVTCDANPATAPAAGAHDRMADFLKEAYISYTDYVLKNPFYEIDMPIKSEPWDAHLIKIVDKYNRVGS